MARTSLPKLSVIAASATDVGLVKKQNEDSLYEVPEIRLYVLCDGVSSTRGGGVASEVAARVAGEHIHEALRELPQMSPAEASELARAAVLRASEAVFRRGQDNPSLTGMATTLDLLWIVGNRAIIAHVGDGRLYLKHKREFHRVSEDHTFGAIFLKDGTFTPEQYATSPLSTHLARAVGLAEAVQPDVMQVELAPGDILLMCSDGLVRGMKDSDVDTALPEEIRDEKTLKAITERFIQQARARGGKDNASIVLLSLGEPGKSELADAAAAAQGPSVRLKVEALRKNPFFGGLSYPNMMKLLELAEYREFAPGSTLMKQGDQPTALWVILSGQVEIRSGEQVLAVRDAGVTIGEAALIDNEPRSATVVAKDTVRTLEFRADRLGAFLGKYAENPAAQVYRALCRFEHQRLADASRKLAKSLTGK